MDLSIIIVSWNTSDLLRDCLASIYEHPPQAGFEVLVIDNASSDGTVDMVRNHFSQVRLIENRQNIGFARANNQGIAAGEGRYVLLLNPDTKLRPGALQRLIHYMESHPEASAVGPKLLNPDGSLQLSCYPAPTLSRELWRLFHLDILKPYGTYEMERWCSNSVRKVDNLLGACLLLRRDILDQVGLLDEDYFIYSEEIDLCYRLRKAGGQLYWVPKAEVIHYGGQSTGQVATEMFLQLYKGKLLYFRKHYGWKAASLYKFILLWATVARLLISPAAWLEKPSRRHRHLSLATNYRRLLSSLPGM